MTENDESTGIGKGKLFEVRIKNYATRFCKIAECISCLSATFSIKNKDVD